MVPTYVERFWNPGDESELSRRDRTQGKYNAYVPDELGVALPQLSSAQLSSAQQRNSATAQLRNCATAQQAVDEGVGWQASYLSHLLIRSESISSS